MAALQSADAKRIDSELEQLEAKVNEARKRKEQLESKQHEAIGRLMLELVSSGEWTLDELHDLLRPRIKRKKDFDLLGILPKGQASGEEVAEVASTESPAALDDLLEDEEDAA